MRHTWDKHHALSILKKWLDDGNWEGTAHFRKHNPDLYEYLYVTMGMDAAFEQLNLDYDDYKKSAGKFVEERSDEEILEQLYSLIVENEWKGIRDLQVNHSQLYREVKRMGFEEAFNRMGLDYREYGYTTWNEDKVLDELREIVESGRWRGAGHLREHHSSLYNAINRRFGFAEAFRKIGLDYEDYKLK